MTQFKGLAHIGLYTNNIEESKKFYLENLGFKLTYEKVVEKPNNQTLSISFIQLGDMTIELLMNSNEDLNKKGSNGACEHLAIEVTGMEEIIKNLKSKGIDFETQEPINMPTLMDGARVIFFSGPSGERLELFERGSF